MFDDILHGEDLQADHWKIYPCEVTPFTKIEQWYNEGTYMPYAEQEPQTLTDILADVKAEVHPWIRLNRVIRDIPEVSIIAGNSNTNLRQAVFAELTKRGQSCRCIRCREVRDWPEAPEQLRLRIREYRSSGGDEFFISVEGGPRGLGGGATQRGLAGTKRVKPTKAEKRARKTAKAIAAASGVPYVEPIAAAVPAADALAGDSENATLYGLLRLRLNDDPEAPRPSFPELVGCALIRELHVYGVLVAAREGESDRLRGRDERPQHGGIGRTLMATAERLAASRGWTRSAVIAGVGVRNYYRRLGYRQMGDGQYLIKELPPCEPLDVRALELPFLEVRGRLDRPSWAQALAKRRALLAALAAAGLAAAGVAAVLLGRRWRRSGAL